MKTKLLIITALLSAFYSLAQTDGWFLYTKPNTISAIVPDDANANILHLATDIGYIQYNTNTSLVTDFLNLTSQNPAIGHVNGLDVNPTNTNIALALDDGIAIYDGTTVTIYNYNNSNLTVGSVGGSEFTKLKVRYGRQGELYIFKPDVTGYQVFNSGVFDTEVITAIRPQDIIENQAGTKVYFAGWNDGLHELTKATTTWVNYTSSNSSLITNTLLALHVDSSDLLYIGGFQGLNTMTGGGTWNTYQQLVPPANVWFYPVYDISLNESNGDLLIRTSTPNSSNFGLSILDLGTNTWTNFTDDNTNCLNTNDFRASAIGGDGNIYSSKSFADNGSLFKFNHNTNTYSEPDINYLNCPTPANSNLLSDFTVRRKASGNLDIGFTRGENLHILEIDPDTFNGTFGTPTTITPSAGKSAYSVLSDNDYFIVETNTGWVFVDGNNAITEFTHSLPGYLAIVTKKAAAFDSDNGIINLVHKGFDALWNYRVYKIQCNTATGTCSIPEEIFTTNRDFTQNIVFGVDQNASTDQVTAVAVKINASAGRKAKPIVKNKLNGRPADVALTAEAWESSTNGSAIGFLDEGLSVFFPNSDPTITHGLTNVPVINLVKVDSKTFQLRTENTVTGESVFTDIHLDKDNDGNPDEILNTNVFNNGNGETVLTFFIKNTHGVSMYRFHTSVDSKGVINIVFALIADARQIDNLPKDTFYQQYAILEGRSPEGRSSQTEATMFMLTNYGMLIKSGIDISSLALSTEDITANDNNLILYPNPANDIVSFSDKTIQNIEVFDINGRSVFKKTGTSFSVKTLSQGVYIVKATNTDNITITKKLIVD